jgi:hypothetical protein
LTDLSGSEEVGYPPKAQIVAHECSLAESALAADDRY